MSFSGLKKAKLTERGEYFTPGEYILAVERTLFKDTRSGDAWIVEFTVLKSNRDAWLRENPDADPKNAPAPVGSKRTWYQGFKDKDVAFNSIFAFLCAMMALDSKKDKTFIEGKFQDASEDIADAAAGEENTFEGFRVNLRCVQVLTKKKTEFTRHDFRPYDYEGDGLKRPTIKAALAGTCPDYPPIKASKKAAPVIEDDEDEDEEETPKPKPKKKVTVIEESDDEDEKPAPKAKAKKKAPVVEEDDEDEDEDEPLEDEDGDWVSPDDPGYAKLKKRLAKAKAGK